MSQVLVFSIVRFNNTDLPELVCFGLNEKTDIEDVKKALINHIVSVKDKIVETLTSADVDDMDDEDDDESDVSRYKADRQETYERILSETEAATSLRELKRHTTLNDGFDEDSGDDIFSYINITIEDVIAI